jgi:hypothetical protein
MNTIFLITGETANQVLVVGRWFANRVSNVYPSIDDVGKSIPEMPVAILAVDGPQGIIPALRKITKADIVHIHVGAEDVRKAQGAERFYHLEANKKLDKDVAFLMGLESIWRDEKALGKPANERTPIHVPV